MNKPSKTDNKRVKHWQRVSAAQFPKSSSIPSANGQVGTRNAFMQGTKRTLNSERDPGASTEQAAEQSESLRNWNNEGGAINPDSPHPKP
jgi:hypothetical protein